MRTPVHPGAIPLESALVALGLIVSGGAERLGVSRVTLSRVLHERARISPDPAVRLEAAGAGSARSWLVMQSARDLAEERAGGTPKVLRLDTVG